MKKTIFISFLLLFAACDEKIEKTSTELKEKSGEKIEKKTLSERKNKDILHQLGFDIDGEKITIDMNKTDAFIKRMEIEMHSKADEIERKIEQADINFTRGLGIELEGDRVAIDLNKTKDMLQQINILMKDILLDVNSTVH